MRHGQVLAAVVGVWFAVLVALVVRAIRQFARPTGPDAEPCGRIDLLVGLLLLSAFTLGAFLVYVFLA